MSLIDLIAIPPILHSIERNLSKRQIMRLLCLCRQTIAAAKYSAIFGCITAADVAADSIFQQYFRRIQIKSRHDEYIAKFTQNVEIAGPPPMGNYATIIAFANKINGLWLHELSDVSAFGNLKYLSVNYLQNSRICLPKIIELCVASIDIAADVAAMFPNLRKFAAISIPDNFKLPQVRELHIGEGTFTVPDSVKVLICGSHDSIVKEQRINNLKLNVDYLRLSITYFRGKVNMNDIRANVLEISQRFICHYHALPRSKYLRICDYYRYTEINRRSLHCEIIELRNSARKIIEHNFTKDIEIPFAAEKN